MELQEGLTNGDIYMQDSQFGYPRQMLMARFLFLGFRYRQEKLGLTRARKIMPEDLSDRPSGNPVGMILIN